MATSLPSVLSPTLRKAHSLLPRIHPSLHPMLWFWTIIAGTLFWRIVLLPTAIKLYVEPTYRQDKTHPRGDAKSRPIRFGRRKTSSSFETRGNLQRRRYRPPDRARLPFCISSTPFAFYPPSSPCAWPSYPPVSWFPSSLALAQPTPKQRSSK